MLLTIKKVKELYDISRITLINWEKEGLITPR
ncbi:DNA-binding transcriptional MerR regulator [Caldanaerobacter subterraneus subsp. tengcongensis MB4]|nr:DNA-binding transcriptional MerR regulator [Caldanaerobacter subterraneus subsp. tengcongensis MB4]